MKMLCAVFIGALLWPAAVPAQTTPARPRRAAAPHPTSVRIGVKDQTGAPLADARLVLSGTSSGEYTTGAAGTAVISDLKPGTYRVRAEHDGFITLEREFTLGTGAWSPIELVLSPAPPPPAPPPSPARAPAAAPPGGGSPVTVAIPDFLDRNFIGREPLKESVLACEPLETVRLLQLRDPLAPHVHDRMDEVVYVVAGDGAIRLGDKVTQLRPGAVSLVPAGTRHAFDRSGKNPLILLSVLTGAPCEAAK